jgi:hypothetical protein
MESKRPGNSSDGAPPAKMAKQEVFVVRIRQMEMATS